MNQHHITDSEFAAALIAGHAQADTEILAQEVRYVSERDVIELVVNRNAGFLIPRQWISALRDVPVEELVKLNVWPDGSAIELEDRDIQISVHGLMTAVLPGVIPVRIVAAIFASRGGKATSASKRSSARVNGRKGGRPRKALSVAKSSAGRERPVVTMAKRGVVAAKHHKPTGRRKSGA